MNVLYISDFPAKFPGAFISSLYYLDKKIHEVNGTTFFIFPFKRPYFDNFRFFGEIYFVSSFSGKKLDLKLIKTALRIVKKNNINIIHSNFGLAGYIAGSIISRLFNIRHISHERTTSHYLHLKRLSPRRIIAGQIFKFLDCIGRNRYIAISSEVKKSLVTYNRIPIKKIKVIQNAVAVNKCKYDSSILLHELNQKKKNGSILIGMIANFSPAKDHFTVIKAAKLVLKQFQNIYFIFVGGNLNQDRINCKNKVEDFIAKNNLQSNFILAGELSNPHPIIKTWDIGLLITKHEGFGNVIIEYMLHKKPVIATSVGGVKDIIFDGTDGILVPCENPVILAERIIFLINYHRIARKIGRSGYKKASTKYNIETWINNILEVYSERNGNKYI